MKIIKSRANKRKRTSKLEYVKALSQFEEARQWQEREAAFSKLEDITQDMFCLLHQFERIELPQEVSNMFREMLRKTRDLRYEVYPNYMGSNLQLSLAALMHFFGERSPEKTFDLMVDESLQLSQHFNKSLNRTIYKVVLEAVRNADQHSQSKDIWVTVKVAPLIKQDNAVNLTVSIEDVGIGFVPPHSYQDYHHLIKAGHFGLAVIQQEVERCGGWLTINSVIDDHTAVEFSTEAKLEPTWFLA